MNAQLLIVIMLFVALHVTALVGGGIALGMKRLLGHRTASANEADERDSSSPGSVCLKGRQ